MHVDHLKVEPMEPGAWRAVANSFKDINHLQLPEYASTLAVERGGNIETVVIRREGMIVGAAVVRLFQVPFLGGGLAYLAGGPLTRKGDGDDLQRFEWSMEGLRRHYTEERGYSLRVLGPIGPKAWCDDADAILKRDGISAADQSRRYQTMMLPIDAEPDLILAGCSKNWRRNLRRAERHSHELSFGRDTASFWALLPLDEDLRARKGFDRQASVEFFGRVQERVNPGDEAIVLQYRDADGLQAGLIFHCLGEVCVPHILVTSVEGLRNYAAYAVTWASLEYAREQGCEWYDLGGIDPEENPGSYDFKRGMRGELCWAPGPVDFACAGVRGRVIRQAERFGRVLRSAA